MFIHDRSSELHKSTFATGAWKKFIHETIALIRENPNYNEGFIWKSRNLEWNSRNQVATLLKIFPEPLGLVFTVKDRTKRTFF